MSAAKERECEGPPEELADLAAGWRAGAEAADGVFAVVPFEVLARG